MHFMKHVSHSTGQTTFRYCIDYIGIFFRLTVYIDKSKSNEMNEILRILMIMYANESQENPRNV